MTLVLVATLAVAGAAGCGGSAGTAARPTTRAHLEIVAPAPNAESGPDVELRMRLSGAKVVSGTRTGGTLRSDRGHIHVRVDGALVAMPYGLTQAIPQLTPGPHTIQAEFVAVDHLPFANRVLSVVSFTVA